MSNINLKLGDQEKLFNDIEDNSIDAIITDPPYGKLGSHKIETIVDFDKFFENCYRVLKDGGFLVYTGMQPSISDWNYIARNKYKFHYKKEVIWNKIQQSTPFHNGISTLHENVMFFSKGNRKFNELKIDWDVEQKANLEFISKSNLLRTLNARKNLINKFKECKTPEDIQSIPIYRQLNSIKKNDNLYSKYQQFNKEDINLKSVSIKSIWSMHGHNKQKFNNIENNVKHPTVKPIQLFDRIIKLTTNENQIILDPFMGSGTTGIASKLLNRKFIGFEIDKDYFNLSTDRIKNSKKEIDNLDVLDFIDNYENNIEKMLSDCEMNFNDVNTHQKEDKTLDVIDFIDNN